MTASIILSLFAVLLIIQLCFNRIFKVRKSQGFSTEVHNKLTKEFLVNFYRRLLVSWSLLIALAIAFSLGHVGITILFCLISFIALREFVSLLNMRAGDYWLLFCSFYIFLPLQYIFVLLDMQFLFFIFLPVYAFLIMPILSMTDQHQFLDRAAKFQWAQIACVYCLSYAPAIASLSLRGYQSSGLLLYLLVVIFFSDAFQYFFGKMYGRTALAVKISPNKTREGAVYGSIVAVIAGLILTPLTPFLWWQSIIISAIMCVLGIFGGLVMSSIKRSMGIKDWGDILGAHGGILDRFDSFIFTAPLFYHLCKYFYA